MRLIDKCKLIEFNIINDEKGNLVAIESFKDVPFEIKRIFYIFGTSPEVIRGQHANKESEFVLICLKGSCKVRIYNDKEENIVTLDQPNIGLYLPKLVWKDMYDFSHDAILLSLSSKPYDKNEYITK